MRAPLARASGALYYVPTYRALRAHRTPDPEAMTMHQRPTTTKLTAADGTALTVVTHVSTEGTVVVRVFRDDELRHASPFMRGEFVAASAYVAETVSAVTVEAR